MKNLHLATVWGVRRARSDERAVSRRELPGLPCGKEKKKFYRGAAFSKQLVSAALLRSSSQQLFSADFLSSSRGQGWAASIISSSFSQQLLSAIILLWSGAGGQVCYRSLEGPSRNAFGKKKIKNGKNVITFNLESCNYLHKSDISDCSHSRSFCEHHADRASGAESATPATTQPPLFSPSPCARLPSCSSMLLYPPYRRPSFFHTYTARLQHSGQDSSAKHHLSACLPGLPGPRCRSGHQHSSRNNFS